MDGDNKLSITDFAKRLKDKYPEYQDIDDHDLAEKVLRKFPSYNKKVQVPEGFKVTHTTSGHPSLDAVYEKAGIENDVDPNLLIEQGRRETIGFKPNVMYGIQDSPKGARGAGQFLAGTARKYGLRVDDQVDERKDPIKSINAQARYMRDLLDQFGNKESLALAGYNAGEHRESLRQGRIPKIKETQDYVSSIGGRLGDSRKKSTGTLKSLISQMQSQAPEVERPGLDVASVAAPVLDAASQTPEGRVLVASNAEGIADAVTQDIPPPPPVAPPQFQLPPIENNVLKKFGSRPVQVTFETPGGKTMTRSVTFGERYKQLQNKAQVLQNLSDCIHGSTNQ
jgi:hypothetical protein